MLEKCFLSTNSFYFSSQHKPKARSRKFLSKQGMDARCRYSRENAMRGIWLRAQIMRRLALDWCATVFLKVITAGAFIAIAVVPSLFSFPAPTSWGCGDKPWPYHSGYCFSFWAYWRAHWAPETDFQKSCSRPSCSTVSLGAAFLSHLGIYEGAGC